MALTGIARRRESIAPSEADIRTTIALQICYNVRRSPIARYVIGDYFENDRCFR